MSLIQQGTIFNSLVAKSAGFTKVYKEFVTVVLDGIVSVYHSTILISKSIRVVTAVYVPDRLYVAYKNHVGYFIEDEFTKSEIKGIRDIIPLENVILWISNNSCIITDLDLVQISQINCPNKWCFYTENTLIFADEKLQVTTVHLSEFRESNRSFTNIDSVDDPIAVTFGDDRLYVASQSNEIRAFALGSNVSCLELNLEFGQSFAFCHLSSGHLAIATGKRLGCWDTKFGTLQAEIPLEDGQYHLQYLFREEDILVVTTSTKNNKSWENSFKLFPYYCSPVNLLCAINKVKAESEMLDMTSFKGPIASVIHKVPLPSPSVKQMIGWKTGVISISDFDTKSLEAMEKAKDDEFKDLFLDWLIERHLSLRKMRVEVERIPKSIKEMDSLLDLPRPELPSTAAKLFVEKFFSSNSSSWCRPVIEYLLYNGIITSSNVPHGLVKVLLAKREFGLAISCLKWTNDLKPEDFAHLLEYILACDQPENLKLLEEEIDAPIKKMNEDLIASNPDIQFSDDDLTPYLSHPPEYVLTRGQHYYLHKVFKYANSSLISSLTNLKESEVEVLMIWINDCIAPKESFSPMWWMWDEEEYEKWSTAVEAFSALIDFQYVTLCRSFSTKVKELEQVIKQDRDTRALLEMLRGPLMQCMEPPKQQSQAKGRWKMFHDQIHNGVGEYAVEALSITLL